MTSVELTDALLHAFGYIFLYIYLGFGPGFILGLLTANWLFGRHFPAYYQLHKKAAGEAAQHNTQWNPANERWHQEE